ncbi:MAG: amidohydrolase family protein [Microbacterium sp.]
MRIASASPATADTVIRGGRIRLFDEADTLTDALAVRDGVVVAVGAQARAATTTARRIVELDGRTAIPGINDAHLHAAWLGARWPHLFFGDHAASHEHSGRLVTTAAERRDALLRAWRLLARFGVTSYTEPGIGPGEDDGETGCFGTSMLDTYLDLHRTGAQTSRVTLLRLFGGIDGESELDAFDAGTQEPPPATDPRWLSIPGVKIFADGIPPMRTAWVCEPYPDGSHGGPLTRGGDSPADAFRRMVRLADERGYQVAVHATGDRSIAEFVDALAGRPRRGADAPPHYVVHADMATPELIARLAAAGIGVTMQPMIAALTQDWAGAQLGAERTAAAWPLGRLLAADVVTTLSSDAPIATPDWRPGLDAALDLLVRDGIGDGASARLRLLHAMTTAPARQDGARSWKGSLEPGMAADVTVLDADPVEPGRPFADLRIEHTIVAGRTVYDAATATTPDDTSAVRPA